MRVHATVTTGTLLAAAVSVGSLFLFASPAAASEDPRVTLCHATGSPTNPYVMITVDAAGAYDGHYLQHDGPHPGEDVIPPSVYEGKNFHSSNWGSIADEWGIPGDADGSAWLLEHGPKHGCLPPPAEGTPATPTDQVLTAEGTPATPTDQVLTAEGSPATPTGIKAASDAAPVGAEGDEGAAGGKAAASALPVGAVRAGDGSAAEDGGSVGPYVLGGIALIGAGGAAFAARRACRASD